jgi:hypothetical protein
MLLCTPLLVSECRTKIYSVRFEVLMVVAMNNTVFWDVTPYGYSRTDVLDELIASIIRI